MTVPQQPALGPGQDEPTFSGEETSVVARAILKVYLLPTPFLVLLAILYVLLPFGLAWMEGNFSDLIAADDWRATLVAPLIVVYILILVPIMGKSDRGIVTRMRPLVQIDDDAYRALVRSAVDGGKYTEPVAFGIGASVGLLAVGPWPWQADGWMFPIYILATNMLMYGLLAWAIAGSIHATRLTNTLLRQPLEVDIFDLTPFEPIGRQSLLLSFSFVVGITISLLLISPSEDFLNPANFVIYSILIFVSVFVFFLNMRPTHRVLASVKARELDDARQQIRLLYRRLQRAHLESDVSPEAAVTRTADLNAWLAMEQRLKLTRTWPYNTEMLRTLTVSVLTPIAVALSRVAVVLLQNRF